ncbi:MAG: transcription elongation factor GreA [Clostridia bacterium]|nr:transcription elongation factor GreA [Clostridia bacterium]MBR3975760.1 transcription elongation factor GreA [Clostridia bacterium]
MADEYVLPLKVIEQLKEELRELRTTGRNDIAEKIKEAKSFGDLSENSEYDEAKSDQAKLEARIAEIEYTLSHATVLDESTLSTESVHTGLSVKVLDRTYNEELVYHIVGAPQANPMQNKVSDESPVGKALLGHKVGDVVIAETPAGNDEIEILEIFKN